MNANQENHVSMFFKVRTFFANNLATIEDNADALTGLVPTLNSKLSELETYDMQATENNTGYAQQKQTYRSAMRDKAVAAAGGLEAYALAQNDNALAQKAHLTKSMIDGSRDTDALYKCERLYEVANTNHAALVVYGVTAAKLSALHSSIIAFQDYIQNPAIKKSETGAAGLEVDKRINDINHLLLIMDGIMDAIATDFPLLYNQYYLDRAIDDNASGTSTPDVSTTIAANSTVSVLTLAYLAGRSFKAKNLGGAVIKWGLSTATDSFSNGSSNLDAGAISTKLSSTLSPAGDNLVFKNESSDAIDIEVTIIE